MPAKASRIGVEVSKKFSGKQIASADVLDEVSGITAEEHINDETIHLTADDFSRVAITEDFKDLRNTPDILNLNIDCGSF